MLADPTAMDRVSSANPSHQNRQKPRRPKGISAAISELTLYGVAAHLADNPLLGEAYFLAAETCIAIQAASK